MDLDNLNTTSGIVKNVSESVKNFLTVIDHILQPRGIDAALEEGHKKIIESIVSNSDIDYRIKIDFLSSYKKTIRERRNCANVIDFAIPSISDNAKPQEVEKDWFNFFFDKVRLISDEAVQHLWAEMLANEVNSPGKIHRSLIHALSIMSKSQAEVFSSLVWFCVYDFMDESVHPLVFLTSDPEFYLGYGIDPRQLLELENLGLIQCDFKDEFVFKRKKMLRYGNRIIELHGDPRNDFKIKTGNVIFTYSGRALFNIVSDDYKRFKVNVLDFAIKKFRERHCEVIVNQRLMQ